MTVSKLLRRTHMYLALFLSPWILGYAISTIAMSRQWTGGPPVYTLERQLSYGTSFPPGTPPREVARQILVDLDLEGAHSVQGPQNGRLTINRQDLVTPRRIVFDEAAKTMTIERVEFKTGALLNRFHRRRGYQQAYAPDRVMAVAVDAVVAAMVFWALSGLWMWWEMRATRRWGLVSMLGGLGMFALLVAVL